MRLLTCLTASLTLAVITGAWADEPTISELQFDQPIIGALEEGDTSDDAGRLSDIYTLEGREGQRVVVHLHSDEFDGVLRATDASGAAHENDDFGSTRDSEVALDVAADGPIEITVRCYFGGETGSYTLSATLDSGVSGLRGSSQDETLPISLGQSIPGRLEPGDQQLTSGEYMDLFALYVQAGTEVTVDMHSGDVDCYLILMQPNGEQWENDDSASGGTLDSQVSLLLPETGEYLIAATTYSVGESGGYEIQVNPGLSATPTQPNYTGGGVSALQPGQTLTGRLESGDETLTSGEFMDAYALQSRAGESLTISLWSEEFDTYVIVVAPDGTQWENDDANTGTLNSELSGPAPVDGEYSVVVTSYAAGESGSYQVAVTSGGGAAPPDTQVSITPLPAGQSQAGALAAGDAQLTTGEFIDRFMFEGEAGQPVSVAMDSEAIDTYLILWHPSGDQQDNDDDVSGQTLNSRIDMTLPETGTYVIGCTSYATGEMGPYTISLALGPDAGPSVIPTASTQRRYHGIFCGISDYAPLGPSDSDLPLCRGDAAKLAEAFRTMGVMDSESCVELLDADATRVNIIAAFDRMAPQVEENDVFVFFYSGHGGQTQPNSSIDEADLRDEYLFTHDHEEISDDEMTALFDRIDAEIALICLDSCFSGGFAKDVIVRPGRMGLFSSEEDLTSAVAGKFQAGGYLSHFFLQGILGQADNDPRNSVLTVGELCHYLQVEFAHNVIESVGASSMNNQRGYQHLVVDRGGVKLDDVLLEVAGG